jgi:hypothetical protein
VDDFRARFGTDFIADNTPLIRDCLTSGILQRDGAMLRLTRSGFLVCDELCAKLA